MMNTRIIEAFERFDMSNAEVRHPASGRLISFDKEKVFRMARVFCQAMHATNGTPPGPKALCDEFISRRQVGWSYSDLDLAELCLDT